MNKISFKNGKLFLALESTFSDLTSFLQQDQVFTEAFGEYYLHEMFDSGSEQMAQLFFELTQKKSEQRIIDFFIDQEKLKEAVPTVEADDLDIFFHTVFISG